MRLAPPTKLRQVTRLRLTWARRRWALALVALLGLAAGLAGESLAESLNLPEFVAQPPALEGDFSEFENSDGELRRSLIHSIELWQVNGQRVVTREYIDGELEATSIEFFKGRKAYAGRFDDQSGFALIPRRPGQLAGGRMPLGEWKRYGWDGVYHVDGKRFGTFELRGRDRFVGFETIETPEAEYPGAARIDTVLRTSFRPYDDAYYGSAVLIRITSHFFPGIGLVKSEERSRMLIDGRVVETRGPIESWFTGGLRGGLTVSAIPEPP